MVVLITLLFPLASYAATATASLHISVTIRPWLKLNTEQIITSYHVSSKDLMRGYIDLPSSAVINIKTNEKRPIVITTSSEGGEKILVKASGAGSFPVLASSLEIGRLQPGVAITKTLDYRVILPQGTHEGTYALNVTVSSQVN